MRIFDMHNTLIKGPNMTKRILIMGLPGSGKTYIAQALNLVYEKL